MNILYFADIRFPLERANGIQTFQTCHALARRGNAVTLVVRPDTAVPARDPFAFYGEEPDSRLTIEPLAVGGRPGMRRAAWLAQAIARAMGGRRSDVLMTRDLALASSLLRLPQRVRPPVLYESHGFAPTVGASLGELLSNGAAASGLKQARLLRREQRVWRRADAYVTITHSLAEELGARFGARARLSVVADGVRLPHGAVPPALVRHHPAVIGYAGHLYPWKGVDVLLEAVSHVADAHATIVGGLAGEPDLERTRRYARSLGLEDRLTLVGAVAPPEVAARLAEMDVLVLPNTATHVSAKYTSPLKLFEYMAAGRPIVASDLPSLREVLRDGENALLVPPGDVRQLAGAIRRVLADLPLATRLARTAWHDVQAYRWEQRAERLERLMAEACAAQSRRGSGAGPPESRAGGEAR
jgi:glycosyltransferase involved in cell wall biosynthesis